jgi:DNA-binding beta-propeller fold protein YncE
VYLTLPDTQRIVVVDTATDSVVKTIDVGTRLLEPAVDETSNRVYFTQQTLPYAVLVLDGATDTVLGRHPVGSCPFATAIDPVRQRLYVTLSGENALQAFDARRLP